jgi:hypothetical protein
VVHLPQRHPGILETGADGAGDRDGPHGVLRRRLNEDAQTALREPACQKAVGVV